LDAGGAADFIGLDTCAAGCVAAVGGFFTGAAAGSNGFCFDLGVGVEVRLRAESFVAAGLVTVAGFNVFC
jgi:hypothetical protein